MPFGLCNADIADVAEVPDVAELTDCGRAVEIPAIGSDLEGCHIPPRVVRFRDPQSPPPFTTPFTPFVFGAVDAEETVDVLEVEEFDASEFNDEDEFERCAGLRGINMRSTSALMVLAPLVTPFEPLHRLVVKFMGGATAVIEGRCEQRGRSKCSCCVWKVSWSLFPLMYADSDAAATSTQ